MSFSKVSFTNAGRALQAKALTGTALVFTKIALGTGNLNGRDPTIFTNLIETKVSLNISKITRAEQLVTLEANFTNLDNAAGFYLREIGLFANDPILGEILYCYGNAAALAEYIPPSTSSLIEKVIKLNAVVGNAQNVSATINTSAFATKKEISDVNMSLTEVNTQLQQIANEPINGSLYLPSDFPTLPFKIYKDKNKYFADLSSETLTAKSTTNVFIVSNGSDTGLGYLYNKPITLNRFKSNLTSGLYGASINFKLIFMENVYQASGIGIVLDSTTNVNITFVSGVGFTWIGRTKIAGNRLSSWVFESGVYKSTQTDATHDIVDIVNLTKLNEFGMPYIYEKVSTLAECQSRVGTYYQLDADVYMNPYSYHTVSSTIAIVNTSVIQLSQNGTNRTVFENIGFFCNGSLFSPNNILHELYLINCKFHRGTQDSFAISGKYRVFLYNCIAAYSSKDLFNYHSDTKDSLAVEINCIGYGAGKYKIAGGNTTTTSNNGSTAHDGLNILRIGFSYWDCQGPIVADINNCYSISIDGSAKDIITTTGLFTAFLYENASNTNRPILANKYVINCTGGGANCKYGIVGTDETYVMNFKGNGNFKYPVKITDWEGKIHG